MTDLYTRLGVAKDATLAQIKSAYRKLAKQHHPDAGGDPDTFYPIAIAYDVLGDEAKRARYDETGEMPGAEKSENAEALAIISALVDGIANDLVMDKPIEHDDLVKRFAAEVDRRIAATLNDRKQAEKFETKALALRKRFAAKTGPDYIGKMIETKISACRRAIDNAAHSLATLERARKILLDATFQVEPRKAEHADPYSTLTSVQGSNFWRGQTFGGL